MSKVNHPIEKCAHCGARHVKVYSWISGRNRAYHFCSLQCKRDFMEQDKPKIEEKEIEDENKRAAEGVLPKVRTLIARKEDERITIVRRDD